MIRLSPESWREAENGRPQLVQRDLGSRELAEDAAESGTHPSEEPLLPVTYRVTDLNRNSTVPNLYPNRLNVYVNGR